MGNKQTAVEWIEEQFFLCKSFNWKINFEQAKQMEKEHLKDAFNAGIGYDKLIDDCDTIFNNYYNETYGK
jgi:hypothetical protein